MTRLGATVFAAVVGLLLVPVGSMTAHAADPQTGSVTLSVDTGSWATAFDIATVAPASGDQVPCVTNPANASTLFGLFVAVQGKELQAPVSDIFISSYQFNGQVLPGQTLSIAKGSGLSFQNEQNFADFGDPALLRTAKGAFSIGVMCFDGLGSPPIAAYWRAITFDGTGGWSVAGTGTAPPTTSATISTSPSTTATTTTTPFTTATTTTTPSTTATTTTLAAPTTTASPTTATTPATTTAPTTSVITTSPQSSPPTSTTVSTAPSSSQPSSTPTSDSTTGPANSLTPTSGTSPTSVSTPTSATSTGSTQASTIPTTIQVQPRSSSLQSFTPARETTADGAGSKGENSGSGGAGGSADLAETGGPYSNLAGSGVLLLLLGWAVAAAANSRRRPGLHGGHR